MRLKRVFVPIRNTAGKVYARRTRPWQFISASTVAAFAIGFVATAAETGAYSAGARTVGSAARSLSTGVVDPAIEPYLNPKLLKAVPVGPGPVSEPVRKVLTSPQMTTVLDASGIPVVALEAYQHAATVLASSDPVCHLPWELLAAIGRVESDDGQFGGAVLLPDGYGTRPIYGIPLDGQDGVALVRNTTEAEAALDGGSSFARAVGPMQFIPSTWLEYGADGNGDGKKDPNNIFDAALAAADYLCAGGGDMTNPAQEAAAVLRYNDADEYVRVVLALAASYEHGDYATTPTGGPPASASSGGGGPAGTPSSSQATAPAPSKAPKPTPVQTPVPEPSAPSGQSTPLIPANPATPPTGGPGANSAPTAPPTPVPTGTTGTGPAPSGQPSQPPGPAATPQFRAGQIVDIGWAPATRQVVVKLLSAPKATPTAPVRPAHPTPQPSQAGTQPARKTTAPSHS